MPAPHRKAAPAPWRNRIVRHGWSDPGDLLANPFNARRHAAFQAKAVETSLDVLGWLDEVKVNVNTQHMVDGHLRVTLAMQRGEQVPVCYLDLTPEEEREAIIWYDRSTELAAWDRDLLLDAQQAGVDLDAFWSPEDLAALLAGEVVTEDLYTRKILSPHYEPSGEVPVVSSLYDQGRTRTLLAQIEATPDLPAEVRTFLTAAAARHTVFNFKRIADYYASAPAPVQALMEASALVIIDWDDAVRGGYLRLAEEVLAQREEEYGDESP